MLMKTVMMALWWWKWWCSNLFFPPTTIPPSTFFTHCYLFALTALNLLLWGVPLPHFLLSPISEVVLIFLFKTPPIPSSSHVLAKYLWPPHHPPLFTAPWAGAVGSLIDSAFFFPSFSFSSSSLSTISFPPFRPFPSQRNESGYMWLWKVELCTLL